MALQFKKVQIKWNPEGEDKFGMRLWVYGSRLAFDYL
jgi:hypothetical protein